MASSTAADTTEARSGEAPPAVKILTWRSGGVAVIAGTVLTLMSFGVHYEEYLGSDHVMYVWGWPLYVVSYDIQTGSLREPSTYIRWLDLTYNWLFFVVAALYARGLWAALRRRRIAPQPLVAALLAPVSVFGVGQLGLPVVHFLEEGGWSFVREAWLALGAAMIALVAMIVFGLPLALALKKVEWFRPGHVGFVGAAISTTLMLGLTGASWGLPVLGAAAGAACALSYWLLVGGWQSHASDGGRIPSPRVK